jgi:omega-6 fatty acid desaturase (delta-12 desaturase)
MIESDHSETFRKELPAPGALARAGRDAGRSGEAADGLAKAEYLALKRALMVRPRTSVNLGVLVSIAGLGTLALWLAGRSWGEFFVAQLLLATVFFQAFALLHECAHGSASSRAWVNVVVGHAASVVCGLPFYPWRAIHQQHHLWTGNVDRDPSLASVRRWRKAGGVPAIVRWSWRSWIPMAALLQHVVFLTYPLRLARAASAQSAADRRQLLRCALSVAFLLLAYPLLFRLAGQYLHPGRWWLGVVIYLVAEELVNLPHHLGMPTTDARLPPWEQWRATRSCRYPWGVSEFFVLNFNFHTEHHLFPGLPWYRLRHARQLVRARLGQRYREEIGIGWNLRHRGADMDAVVLAPPGPSNPPLA